STSQITVGLHIGWITSYLGKAATRAQSHSLEPDADSRLQGRSRQPPAELSTGTPLERCERSDRFAHIVPQPASRPKKKSLRFTSRRSVRGSAPTTRRRFRPPCGRRPAS